jgi:hypothetical protein
MTLPRLKEGVATKRRRGLVLFKNIGDALRAWGTLREEGYDFKLVAPSPKMRKGCGLALEINLVERPGIELLFKQQEACIIPLDNDTSKLLENVRLTDFGDWLMIKVGSMKLTYHKHSGIIVNISGSGCPDVPYLYAEMVDKPLTDVSRPRDIGFSPCALLLDQALQKAHDLCKGDN